MRYVLGVVGLALAGALFFVNEIAGIVAMVLVVVLLPWTPSPSFGAQAGDE